MVQTNETLRHWVRQHKVTWELSPRHEMVDGLPRIVGYDLRLYGSDPRRAMTSPGASECIEIYDRLRSIGLSVVPAEQRPTVCTVESFDSSLHMRPESAWEPEVEVTIEVTHRSGYLGPLDACEKRCAEEIQESLRRLGAQPGRWADGSGWRTV